MLNPPTASQALTPAAAVETPPAAPPRLASLDVFRGLVILTMTFVNYLAGVSGMPWWAKHLPEHDEGYTFVDVVFPGFLFIVGVALPLAFQARLGRGDSRLRLAGRVLARSAALLFVGVITVNTGAFSAKDTGLSKSLWFLLAMVSIVVLWNRYPRDVSPAKKRVFLGLRVLAGLVLALLLVFFRGKTASGGVVWLQHSWWGILGLIGWAYLVCALAYLFFRGSAVALMGSLGFLIALYIGDKHGVLGWSWLNPVHNFVGIGQVLGSTAADVMIGVLVSCFFVSEGASLLASVRARRLALFGAGLFFAGQLLRPLHGINKVAATDAYALVTGGICCLCFLAVYLVVDVARLRRWAGLLSLVGQNALLAYILPGMLNNLCRLLGVGGVLWQYDSGLAGALNAAALTLLVMLLTWGATKLRVQLRL